MLLPQALMNTAPLNRSIAPSLRSAAASIRSNATSILLQSQWQSQPIRALLPRARAASSTNARVRPRQAVIPERINVYRAGVAATVGVGMCRVATIGAFMLGSLWYAPAFYFSPDHSNWLVPVVLAGSAVPFVVTALCTGPMVHSILVRLPARARRSKDDLIYFSKYPPKDTIIELQFMRWKPWLQGKGYRFDRLRRLTPSLRGGIANLEVVNDEEEHAARDNPRLARFLSALMGRYFVNRQQKNDRAAVPGVWDNMWQRIPLKGQRGVPELRPPQVNVKAALPNRKPLQPQKPANT